MSKMYNDKLFRFLRQKLISKQLPDQEWNTPPDSVFEAAMLDLESSQNEDKADNPFWILFVPIFMIIINVYNTQSNTHPRLDSQAKFKTANSIVQEEFPVSVGTKISTSDPILKDSKNILDKKRILNSELNLTQVNQNYASAASIIDDTQSQNTIHTKKSTQRLNSVVEKKIIDEHLVSNQKDLFISRESLTAPLIEKILPQYLEKNNYDLQPFMVKISESETQSKLSLGILANTNLSTFSMSNIDQNSPQLKNYDNYHSGSSYGLQIDYKINSKIAAVFDFGYTEFSNSSTLSQSFDYDKNKEFLDGNGNPHFANDFPMHSPIGTHFISTQFSVGEIASTQRSSIDQFTNSSQIFKALYTGVGLRYNIYNNSAFEIYTGLGINYTQIISFEESMSSDMYMSNKHVDQLFVINDDRNSIVSSIFSSYLEAGLRYSIFDNAKLHFRVQLLDSFNSLRTKINSTDPSTYLKQYNIGGGMLFDF